MVNTIRVGNVSLIWNTYDGDGSLVINGKEASFDGETLIRLHELAIMFAATEPIE